MFKTRAVRSDVILLWELMAIQSSLVDTQLRAGFARWIARLAAPLTIFVTAAAVGVSIGWALVAHRYKPLFALLALGALAIGPTLSTRARFAMLWASVPLTVFVTSGVPIPYSLGATTILLAWICGLQLLFPRETDVRVLADAGSPVLPVLMLFAAVAAIPAYLNGQTGMWGVVCLAPLLFFWASATLVSTARQAWMIVVAAVSAMWTFVGFLFFSILVGHATNLNPQAPWRIGEYLVSWGPIEYPMWSVTFGTLVGLAVPALVMLLLRRDSTRVVLILATACLLASLALLFLSAARGAVVGAAIGSCLVLFFSGRYMGRLSALLGVVVVTVGVVGLVPLALGGSLNAGTFQTNVERIGSLAAGDVSQNANFRYRMRVLDLSLRESLADPLGPGVGYLGKKYGLYDEAVMYSVLLLGTGVMGAFAFLAIVVLLVGRYVRAMRHDNNRHDLAVLGLATLACGLVSGVVTESVLLGPVQSIVWWSILAACYFGCGAPDGGRQRGG